MVTELRKTARSVLYNIAEGHKRSSTLEFIRFLDIADGSAAELETQFYLSQALSYVDDQSSLMLVRRLLDIERMLAALKRSLRRRLALPPPPTDP
jgi:four helix bundle protein